MEEVAEEIETADGIRYALMEDVETNATFNLIVKFMSSVRTMFVLEYLVETILTVMKIVFVLMIFATSKFVIGIQIAPEDTSVWMEDANHSVKPQEIVKMIKSAKMASVSLKQFVSETVIVQETKSVLLGNVQIFVKSQDVLPVLQGIAYQVQIVSFNLIVKDCIIVIMKMTLDFVFQEVPVQLKGIVQEAHFAMLDVVAQKIDATNTMIANMAQDANRDDVSDLLVALMIWIVSPMNIVKMEFAGGHHAEMIPIVNRTKNVLKVNV